MIETLIALVLGHALGDFALQPDAMARRKREPLVLILHVAVVTAATWAALGFAPAWGLIGLVAASHLAIDAAKAVSGAADFRAFALDQAAHLAVLVAGALAFPGAWASGLWAGPAVALAPELALLPRAMVVAAGLVLVVWAGGYAVAALMKGIQTPPAESLPKGGRMIGKLERLLILMLILAGEPGAIGFLIAAKSILRFNELAGEADRHVSEYVIIGTLASFAWAIAGGYATLAALEALGGAASAAGMGGP